MQPVGPKTSQSSPPAATNKVKIDNKDFQIKNSFVQRNDLDLNEFDDSGLANQIKPNQTFRTKFNPETPPDQYYVKDDTKGDLELIYRKGQTISAYLATIKGKQGLMIESNAKGGNDRVFLSLDYVKNNNLMLVDGYDKKIKGQDLVAHLRNNPTSVIKTNKSPDNIKSTSPVTDDKKINEKILNKATVSSMIGTQTIGRFQDEGTYHGLIKANDGKQYEFYFNSDIKEDNRFFLREAVPGKTSTNPEAYSIKTQAMPENFEREIIDFIKNEKNNVEYDQLRYSVSFKGRF